MRLAKLKAELDALNETMMAQQKELGKYQKETKRLADELRNLSEAIRLMSQDMENQMGRIYYSYPSRRTLRLLMFQTQFQANQIHSYSFYWTRRCYRWRCHRGSKL